MAKDGWGFNIRSGDGKKRVAAVKQNGWGVQKGL